MLINQGAKRLNSWTDCVGEAKAAVGCQFAMRFQSSDLISLAPFIVHVLICLLVFPGEHLACILRSGG